MYIFIIKNSNVREIKVDFFCQSWKQIYKLENSQEREFYIQNSIQQLKM